MSHRPRQVASTIHRQVQTLIARGFSDPRIRGLVTVTGVEVTPDLHRAQVRISVLPPEHAATTMKGLHHATLRIQRRVNENLRMRRPPRIEFVLDDSLKRQADVLAAIRRAVGPEDEGEATAVTESAAEVPTDDAFADIAAEFEAEAGGDLDEPRPSDEARSDRDPKSGSV